MPKFHDLSMASITGDDVDFSTFKDQVCLVINVASA
jgi:glutathione peroxidase-family protein